MERKTSISEMSDKEQLNCCKIVLKQIYSASYSELLKLENSDTADQYVAMLMACIKDVRRHTKKAMKKLNIDIN
jgi:hypothetical protein